MSLNLKARIRSGYIIAFLLLLVSYTLIFYIIQQLAKGTAAISHTYTVMNKLESLKAEMTDAETGVRGYIITGEESFLEPYHNAVKVIPVIYKDIKTLTHDNSYQQHKLDTLTIFIGRKLGYLSELRNYKRTGLTLTMTTILEQGKHAMDSIRLIIASMKAAEENLMKERSDSLRSVFNSTNIIAITSLLAAFITILYSIFVYKRENKAKEQADKETKLYRLELENKVKELKQVNAELHDLKQIEKFAATGRIARTIAHEVRNPLTNISLATEQLNETSMTGEESAFLLDMIRRNASRIDQLVSDLLHSTRFAQLDFIKVNIIQLVDETLELAKDRIELKNIAVQKKYTADGCEALVDAEKIKLGLLNIMVNAIEAMEKGEGVLTLTIYKNGPRCVIEIHDNGSGMDDDMLQKIFEPYYTSKSKGMGLGLTHTQNIILNHRGNISVKSKPGWGTSFFVTLQID